MAEINENEVLYMLTIPRFNMPDFGSLDEDYLCREDQLTWYVSEDELEWLEPGEVLARSQVSAADLDCEYVDGEFETWNFWVGEADAQCVYIQQDETYFRYVKVDARDVLMIHRPELETDSVEAKRFAFRRIGEVSGFSGIFELSEISDREWAGEKESLHNRISSNLYYMEREFETLQEMLEDVRQPRPVQLRRFFEDILEQK